MTIAYETIVTIAFWGAYAINYPAPPPENKFTAVTALMNHSVPFLMLIIDFCLNAIVFNPSHVVIALIVVTVYGLMNMTIVLATYEPIYPILTWRDYNAIWCSISVLAMIFVSFMICAYVSICKNRYCNKMPVKHVVIEKRPEPSRTILFNDNPHHNVVMDEIIAE
jgi:hypothetical protein